jgi:hypothetical protein
MTYELERVPAGATVFREHADACPGSGMHDRGIHDLSRVSGLAHGRLANDSNPGRFGSGSIHSFVCRLLTRRLLSV